VIVDLQPRTRRRRRSIIK
jgi:hypothetical protein